MSSVALYRITWEHLAPDSDKVKVIESNMKNNTLLMMTMKFQRLYVMLVWDVGISR